MRCSEHYTDIPKYIAADPLLFPDPLPGFDLMTNYQHYAVEDTVVVPADLEPGEYVLSPQPDPHTDCDPHPDPNLEPGEYVLGCLLVALTLTLTLAQVRARLALGRGADLAGVVVVCRHHNRVSSRRARVELAPKWY